MENLNSKNDDQFDISNRIVKIMSKLDKRNAFWNKGSIRDLNEEIYSIERDMKIQKEERKQDDFVEQNQSVIVGKILFYISTFFSICFTAINFFPTFYPSFFKIFDPILPSFCAEKSIHSLPTAVVYCFILSCFVNNFERARYIKLQSWSTKLILISISLVLFILLNPFGFAFLLLIIGAEKYLERIYRSKPLVNNALN